jgi:4-hydroxy-2-oxoheptanedioate aldolase
MQHGQHTIASVIAGIGAVHAAGKHVLMRIPLDDFATASRALDAGAEGVVAPMINTVEDARRFAAAMKFPPLGERSWGPLRAMALDEVDGQGYLERANTGSVAIAMIETPRAIDNVDQILAVDGIDGILVGPGDLSVTLTAGERIDPSGAVAQEAIARIAGRARAAGKFCAIFCNTVEDARKAVALGAPLIALGVDALLLRAASDLLVGSFRD